MAKSGSRPSALLALSAGSLSTAAAAPGADAVDAAKKKKSKCKKAKKGKRGKATAAKKCKKAKKKTQPQPYQQQPQQPSPSPVASGPEIPTGDYVCSYAIGSGTAYAGTVHILAGNSYRVNEGSPGSYRYFPDTGIMQFPTGDYQSFYARYSPDSKGFDVYSAVNDGILEVGDYGWTCSLD